jgi:hypothetical protein
MGPLGRREPTDWRHVERYPLAAAPVGVSAAAPVVLGINWYSNFDDPKKGSENLWWIGKGDLGYVRGGHAVCIPSQWQKDVYGWHSFYDQGEEGACVGFSASRCMSLLNRRRYDGFWLYHQAQFIDEWPGEDYDGTSVRAGMDVLRLAGHVRVYNNVSEAIPRYEDGISANRWATTVDELLQVLQSPNYEKRGAVPIMNSWGTSYPRKVWMPLETLQRLLDEYGEATMLTDR